MTEKTTENSTQSKGRIHVCGVTCQKGNTNCNGYCTDPKVPHAKLIEASTTESAIEAEIVAKGKTAPRVTPADIDACITSEHYFTAGEGVYGAGQMEEPPIYPPCPKALKLLTFCVLVLRNGFTVTGESACASPENFDEVIARKIARENAKQKIWMLEGYVLKTSLAAYAALNG
jgi:hypothetical protein